MPQWPLQRECDKFYGNPRGAGNRYNPKWADANLVHVHCPWSFYSEGKSVPYITIHKKCAESLGRVLQQIWAGAVTQAGIERLGYHKFSGSFNYRPKRSGVTLSMHSYGCAIDWNDAENPYESRKHLFQSDSLLVVKFKAEGWIWGGDWKSPIDAMHVQAARVR